MGISGNIGPVRLGVGRKGRVFGSVGVGPVRIGGSGRLRGPSNKEIEEGVEALNQMGAAVGRMWRKPLWGHALSGPIGVAFRVIFGTLCLAWRIPITVLFGVLWLVMVIALLGWLLFVIALCVGVICVLGYAIYRLIFG